MVRSGVILPICEQSAVSEGLTEEMQQITNERKDAPLKPPKSCSFKPFCDGTQPQRGAAQAQVEPFTSKGNQRG